MLKYCCVTRNQQPWRGFTGTGFPLNTHMLVEKEGKSLPIPLSSPTLSAATLPILHSRLSRGPWELPKEQKFMKTVSSTIQLTEKYLLDQMPPTEGLSQWEAYTESTPKSLDAGFTWWNIKVAAQNYLTIISKGKKPWEILHIIKYVWDLNMKSSTPFHRTILTYKSSQSVCLYSGGMKWYYGKNFSRERTSWHNFGPLQIKTWFIPLSLFLICIDWEILFTSIWGLGNFLQFLVELRNVSFLGYNSPNLRIWAEEGEKGIGRP